MPLNLLLKLGEMILDKIIRLAEDTDVKLWRIDTNPSYYPSGTDKMHFRFHFLRDKNFGRTYNIVVTKKSLVINCQTHKNNGEYLLKHYQYQKSF